MKKVILWIVGIDVALVLLVFGINYFRETYPIECIGFVENMELDDKTTFSCWKTSPERAKSYLKYLSNIETVNLEEIKKVEAELELLGDEERILIAVAGEVSYIAIEDNFGICMLKKGTVGTKKVYFYTTEYEGRLLPQ